MPLLERGVRSEGRGVCAKMENRTFATGGGRRGVSKKRTSANKGEGGSKNHPIYANIIIEWFPCKMVVRAHSCTKNYMPIKQ